MNDEERPDPLYLRTALTHTVTLPVLGHPVTYATNSDAVSEAVEQAYGRWRHLSPGFVSSANFSINVVLHDGDEGGNEPCFAHRMPTPDRLFITTRGSCAVVEVDRRRAFAYVTSELVGRTDLMRTGILDAMTLMLITSADRCPIHAAAMRHEERLLVLTGPSGSGKSTLAYALLAAGYDVLGDDTVYVQTTPEARVWCSGDRVSLLRSAAAEFAALRGVAPRLMSTGKVKVVVPLAGAAGPEPSCRAPRVCVLSRGTEPHLTRLAAPEVRAMLSSHVEPGFELRPAQRAAAVAWLSEQGGWQLTLSSRATAAIPLIEEVLAS